MLMKRKWIVIGAISGVVGIAAITLIVTASIVDPVKKYIVNIKSKDNARYLVTQLNTQQNKADFAGKDIFDIVSTDGKAKNAVAKFLEIDKANVIGTLNEQKISQYKNGLEKLIYDLIYAKKNGENLIVILSTYREIDEIDNKMKNKNVTIKFDEKFLNSSNSKEKKKIIHNKLKDAFFIRKDKFSGKLISSYISFYIYNSKEDKVVKLTTELLDEAVKAIKL